MSDPAPAPLLPDGTYDAFVVDATEHDPGTDPTSRVVHLDLAITAGEHKGEVLALTAAGLRRDPLDLLAAPGTLVVEGGAPRLQLEG